MRIVEGLKQTGAFIFTTLLSCGPSQIIGAIKLIIDGGQFVENKLKQHKISSALTHITKAPDDFQNVKIINQIAQRLQKQDLTKEDVEKYLTAQARKLDEKASNLSRSIGADCAAFIPLAGAHLSWRIATEYKGNDFPCIFSNGVQYLLQNTHKLSSKPFFWGRAKNTPTQSWPIKDGGYLIKEIPVNLDNRSRTIEGFFAPPYPSPSFDLRTINTKKQITDSTLEAPVVVLFHPNLNTARAMYPACENYRKMGFKVLAVTCGGYAGSLNVTTSEKSMYQDIEAIKLFLKENGVKEVAWHGMSMGTGMAIQAGADKNPDGLKTLFVVADQPYDSAPGVGNNVVRGIGKGVMLAAFPMGEPVVLPGGREVVTDGLNSLAKADQLKDEDIPLICIGATQDRLMGRNKIGEEYQDNFAFDLAKKRYDDNSEAFTIREKIEHGGTFEWMKLYSLLSKEKLLPSNEFAGFFTSYDLIVKGELEKAIESAKLLPSEQKRFIYMRVYSEYKRHNQLENAHQTVLKITELISHLPDADRSGYSTDILNFCSDYINRDEFDKALEVAEFLPNDYIESQKQLIESLRQKREGDQQLPIEK